VTSVHRPATTSPALALADELVGARLVEIPTTTRATELAVTRSVAVAGPAAHATNYGYSFQLYGEAYGSGHASPTQGFTMTQYTSSVSRTTAHWSAETTRRHGVSGAHDPKSGARIQVWRNKWAEIRVQVIEGFSFSPSFQVLDGSGLPLRAFDTPTIACGDVGFARNCIIAWADPAAEATTTDYHFMRWMHFSVQKVGSTWMWNPGPIMVKGFIMFGSPVVSYRGPSTSYPYLLSWEVPGFGLWTIGKTSAETADWNNATLVGHGSYSGRIAAALGSANQHSELVHIRR